jgi:hypothetical protein
MTNEEELAKIIYFSREIETILRTKFQAKGKGLHTYIDSIENKIEIQLVKDLRYIATIRNKSMHESSFKVDNFSRYKRVAEQSIYRLNNLNINREISQPANRKMVKPIKRKVVTIVNKKINNKSLPLDSSEMIPSASQKARTKVLLPRSTKNRKNNSSNLVKDYRFLAIMTIVLFEIFLMIK